MNVPVPVNGSMMWTSLSPSCRTKLASQNFADAVDDEVYDFDGCIDDAESFGHARERGLEEFVVKFDDDALPAFGIVDV